jgi:7,8-dihydro-6-hydroxymethylpterin dimethyltransferase
MVKGVIMAAVNYGLCEKCRKRVPVTHVIRERKAYMNKACPDCGTTTALISSDSAAWQAKRDLCGFDPATARTCNLQCTTCNLQGAHQPRLAFLDITNRCNMNCPICIANIPKMGFLFHPPLSYFEHVLDGIAKMEPTPEVLLFGGEPTVREDMFEIISMAQARGLSVGIVTNGLRLADEDFCKKVCDSGARVLIAFDGRSPEVYTRLRKASNAYEKKVKALENLKKHSKIKHTIMCCVARGVNDKLMRDLVDFCHESRSFIAKLHLLPLTETWEKGEFDVTETTTIEDVERIMNEGYPGEPVEFVPLGLGADFVPLVSFFGKPRSQFSGVHPNCESITTFISDGTRYRPLSHYLKRPVKELADELATRTRSIRGKLDRLDPNKRFQRLRGQLLLIRTFLGPALRSINTRTAMKGNRYLAGIRLVGGLLTGNSLKDQLKKHTHYGQSMDMIILPFEEEHSLEGARLCRCKAAFAYEDPDDGRIKTVPVCTWSLVRVPMEKRIAEKYGVAAPGKASAPQLVGAK